VTLRRLTKNTMTLGIMNLSLKRLLKDNQHNEIIKLSILLLNTMTLIIISSSITPLTTMTLDKIKPSLTIITIISFRIMTLLYSSLL